MRLTNGCVPGKCERVDIGRWLHVLDTTVAVLDPEADGVVQVGLEVRFSNQMLSRLFKKKARPLRGDILELQNGLAVWNGRYHKGLYNLTPNGWGSRGPRPFCS